MATRTPKCLKCGGPVPDDRSVCGKCNPAHLTTPARNQVHGTMVGILLVAVVLAALIGSRFVSAGEASETYDATVVQTARISPSRVGATIQVVNLGGEPDTASCRVRAQDRSGALIAEASVETGEIGTNRSATAEVELEVAAEPADFDVDCR